MREILFRAKRIDNGEWIYGYIWRGNDHSYIIPHNVGIGYDDETKKIISAAAYEIDPETICQYIGLTDKNGKKIFEGDAVKAGEILVVSWKEKLASWCLCKKRWMYNHFFGEAVNAEDCEVIDNIFDYPELAGKESERSEVQ